MINNRTENPRIASGRISKLEENEIFVFGSNLQGMHGGGAARIAYERFGAVWGVGVGITGRCYAIPTMQGGIETIKPYIDQFIDFAKQNPNLKFLVTRIGCGIAGFTDADIAPLFAETLKLDNVYLPKSFFEELVPKPQMPDYIEKKIYGQTRTLVDILIGLNERKHFKSPDEALCAMSEFLKGLRGQEDEISFNCSVRSLCNFARSCFVDGYLDTEKLKQFLKKDFYNDNIAVKAYMNYIIEKTMKLIMYMNEFRRYTNADQIINDFQQVNRRENYFDFGHYPLYFFECFVYKFWQEFAPNGELNNSLFNDFMIGRHARGIKKYGLESVVNRNYKNDDPCHPEVLFPYRGGGGPVYIERIINSNACGVKQNRRFIKSCGEGIGPNAIIDYFEFHLVKNLIVEDPKYTVIEYLRGQTMIVPKDDVTLPVYDYYLGKKEFDSPKAQEAVIRRIWKVRR